MTGPSQYATSHTAAQDAQDAQDAQNRSAA